MYDIIQSAVILEEEKSKPFSTGQGWHMVVACHLSFFNQLLDEVEKAGIGITVKNDVKGGGLMFADDFVD